MRDYSNIVAAFEVWDGNQTSGFYSLEQGDNVSKFIDDHNNSGTFARIEVFTDLEIAKKRWQQVKSWE